MPLRLGSSFELAFRRAVFSLLLLLLFLLFNALLLSLLGQFEWAQRTARVGRQSDALKRSRRMDFERHELISTLWAESVAARSESDWSLAANAKLDAYERMLASEAAHFDGTRAAATMSPSPSYNPWTFAETVRTLLTAVTTMGGGALSEIGPSLLGPATKLLSALFLLFGIPLTLIHIGHCVKAANALIEANFGKSSNLGLFVVAGGTLLVAAIVVDIATVETEEEERETSFFDSLFSVFLAFGTISSPHSLRHFSPFLLLPFSIVLLTVAGLVFGALQRSIELWVAPHEFAFANGICGQIGRAVSAVRLSGEEDEGEELDELEPKQHHQQTHTQQGLLFRAAQFEFGDCSQANDPSTTTPFGTGRRSIVGQTIHEDDEEQQQHSPANFRGERVNSNDWK
ncbi:hypothetical protein niasHT_030744 [Heterodera trifolii]|uniref:Uncharacterized protein n=1 Tax=Heterodera trifolii TaxID=157864 RepID=A0ABD2HXA7_9BILA